jgi:hypothetical protein
MSLPFEAAGFRRVGGALACASAPSRAGKRREAQADIIGAAIMVGRIWSWARNYLLDAR